MLLKQLITGICFCLISSSAFSAVYFTDSWSNGNLAKITKLKPSGISCNLIAGENRYGAIIAGGYQNRTIKYVTSYKYSNWAQLADPRMQVSHITGDNRYGTIVAHGRTVKYMSSYRNNTWVTLRSAPVHVEGIAGDNRAGPVIFNGQDVWYMDSYRANTWHKLHRPAPFRIKTITGNNREGIIALGYYGEAAYVSRYKTANWTWLTGSYDGVDLISGTIASGLILFDDDYFSGPSIFRNVNSLIGSSVRWKVVTNREELKNVKTISSSGSSSWGALICTSGS